MRNVVASSGTLNRLTATVSQVVHGTITEEAGSWLWIDGGETEDRPEDEGDWLEEGAARE